ncbi:SDR family NAD(P)-dependent oxidoreductase [Pseudooceanicola sp. C21-150M6]|uniref:SDR family NAD(P)-dependent oxidoreductase n=1 Tax=Pseudooceanicola sp. C21-150M6 TaxID=3434355 RepID=UPI003D7F31EA
MTDRIALITGASRGLGAALAKALAPTHHIVAVARTVGALEELDDAIQAAGGAATLAPMDVTNADAMAQLCRSVHDRWGGAALWCHTAIHTPPLAPANHIDAKDWAKSVECNVSAIGILIPYIGALLGPNGKAVFFDDPSAGQKFHGAYGATKAAQIQLAKVWAAETSATGPTVKVLTPAPMPTALRARFHPGEDRSALTHPDEVAAALLPELM